MIDEIRESTLFDKTLRELEELTVKGEIQSICCIMVVKDKSYVFGRGEVRITLASVAAFLEEFPAELLLTMFTEILTRKGVNPQKPVNATLH